MIQSNVPARVFIDGAYVGNTPYVMSDTKIVGSTTSVRLEAPGYETTQVTIHRSEQFDMGACIGGVFLLVPFLWIEGYQPEHMYMLSPAQGAPPPPGYPPPAGNYPPPPAGNYPPPPAGNYPPPPAGNYPPPPPPR